MSDRLHARKVNKIEYGDIAAFNDTCKDTIRNMLYGFSEEIWESEDENELEMPKSDLKAGIDTLLEMSDEEFSKEYETLIKEGYTKDKVISILNGLLEEADPNNDEIRLDWF